MNQYWILAFITLLGGTFFLGDRYGANSVQVTCDKHEAAQQQETIVAEKHVIGEVQTQNQITQESTNAFSNELTAIRNLYGITGVQQPGAAAGGSVRPIPASPAGACAFSGPAKSKAYKLTFEQCDQEEAKCNALWNWANQQADVK